MKSSPPFDLVILDLDGTILNPNRVALFTDNVVQAIAATQQCGVPVTIGTGRTLDLMRPYAESLNISVPVITTQGAVVADLASGTILFEMLMPIDAAREVAAWIDDSENITVFYFTDPKGHVTIYQNCMDGDQAFYDHVFGSPRIHNPRFSSLVESDRAHPPVKFITINDPTEEGDITQALSDRFTNLTIARTHAKLVEGTAKGINKGVGVRKLCEVLSIDPQRVMAVGDNDNDIPMLEAVGTGIAMGNASPGVKAVADWIAPSIEEDGAAAALERFILSQVSSPLH